MIALIEDEEHKANALLQILTVDCGACREDILVYGDVRSAVLAMRAKEFSLVLLDMALPTFPKEDMQGSMGKAQQPGGGLEVIRTLSRRGRSPATIIITQFDDVPLNEGPVPLSQVSNKIWQEYKQRVVAAIQYSEDKRLWKNDLVQAARKVIESPSN